MLNEKHEVDERWEAVGRRHKVFGIGGVILTLAVVGLAVLAWREYPELKRHEATLTALPAIQQSMDGMGDRVKEVDSKIAGWANDKQVLIDRVAKLGQRMETRLEAVRKQAVEASAETMRHLQARIDSQVQGVETRVAHLESARDGDQTRAAELQRELNQVRGELVKQADEVAKQADELNAVRRDMGDTSASHERQLAGLKEREERDQRDVAAIQHHLTVRRVDFEVTKNHSRELAEGISIDVTGTDVLYRKVSGWMWVLPDRRTIWLKGQGAQEPVIFYGYKDGKKRELVITNVTKNSVTGYLLLPPDASDAIASVNRMEKQSSF
jgi:predicted  nucleic acid-binding Zn-ribbon protein